MHRNYFLLLVCLIALPVFVLLAPIFYTIEAIERGARMLREAFDARV